MPFFTNSTQQQVQAYCDKQTNRSLTSLAERIERFINDCNMKYTELNSEMRLIADNIEEIDNNIDEIEAYNSDAERYNKHVMSNLCGNGSERYLAMQQLRQTKDTSSLYQTKRDLFNELRELSSKKSRWEGEKRACQQELNIVKQTLEQREIYFENNNHSNANQFY